MSSRTLTLNKTESFSFMATGRPFYFFAENGKNIKPVGQTSVKKASPKLCLERGILVQSFLVVIRITNASRQRHRIDKWRDDSSNARRQND